MQFMGGNCGTPVAGLRQVQRVIFLFSKSEQQQQQQSRFLSQGKKTEVTSQNSVGPPSFYDQIGPADPVSNIRPIRFYIPENESQLHKRYRLLRQDTLRFNTEFWAKHNTEFAEAREKFVAKVMRENYPTELNKKTISTEEMSEFYKSFLDSQWSSHLNYNLEWQKRNFMIAALSVFVGFENLFKRKY